MTKWTRGHRLAAVLLVVLGLAVISVVARQGDEAREREQSQRADRIAEAIRISGAVEVAYYVTGSGTAADITLSTPTGIEQISARIPLFNKRGDEGLRFEFDRNAYVAVSAQKRDEYGEITCRITVDGETISENTSNAAYGIASCSGRAATR